MKLLSRSRSVQPPREEKATEASAGLETWETVSCFGSPHQTRKAPAPFDAYQRRRSAGAETTETTASASSKSVISVAHTGPPRAQFLVPSIGSITHWRPVVTG